MITASVSPGLVPDLPISTLSLTIGNVEGRVNTESAPMPKPLRAATDTDTLACRASDFLPPTGASPTATSLAFRFQASTTFGSWSFGQSDELLSQLPITGCAQ